MKVNFDIKDNIALKFEGHYIDLHNNFKFIGFDYNVNERELKMSWTKSNGDWVKENELSSLILTHKLITFLTITYPERKENFDDDKCLGEITFFPSSSREINDSMTNQAKPNDEDDILYFFENGQFIIINCEQVELSINLPNEILYYF